MNTRETYQERCELLLELTVEQLRKDYDIKNIDRTCTGGRIVTLNDENESKLDICVSRTSTTYMYCVPRDYSLSIVVKTEYYPGHKDAYVTARRKFISSDRNVATEHNLKALSNIKTRLDKCIKVKDDGLNKHAEWIEDSENRRGIYLENQKHIKGVEFDNFIADGSRKKDSVYSLKFFSTSEVSLEKLQIIDDIINMNKEEFAVLIDKMK